jgi:tetratricopeptide (TPR) repeat protein
LLSDPATRELLYPLRALVNERLAREPRDAGLLALRAELAGQWSGSEAPVADYTLLPWRSRAPVAGWCDSEAQVADYSAAIRALAHQSLEAAADLNRLYRGRGNAYIRLQKWREAARDYAHVVTEETTDVELLSNRARAHEALKNWDAAAADWSAAVSGNPAGARLLGEFARRLAAGGQVPLAKAQFEKAQALYERMLEADPENSLVAAELAQLLFLAFQSAGRTREAVPYLAKASRAEPSDMLLLQVAALQAWFGQEKELAATRQRIQAFAKETHDAGTAERAAKAYSIRMSTSKAELDAALALARKGVEFDHGSEWREWRLLALGMAEYRSGNHAAATQALLAAAKGGSNDPTVTGISAFYRAMSLSRQGKSDEARKLAIGATAQMKPLPKDEQNPPVSDAYWDDLILWLAYKEAKALIGFDAAPAAPATPDGK